MTTPVRVFHLDSARTGDSTPHRESADWTVDDRLAVEHGTIEEFTQRAAETDCLVLAANRETDPLDALGAVRESGQTCPLVVLPSEGESQSGKMFVFDTDGSYHVVALELTDGPADVEDGSSNPATSAGPSDSGAIATYPDVASVITDIVGVTSETDATNSASETAVEPSESTDGRYETKIRALHDVAVNLVGCETDDDAFELAIEAADQLLDFDHSTIYVREGDKLAPAVAADSSIISLEGAPDFELDQGVMGHVHQTGDSIVVADAQSHDIATPTSPRIRSGVTVPLGDIGVFNAVSDNVGAFDDEDRALAEILASHVTTAVERIRSDARTRRERNRFAALFENIPDAAMFGEYAGDETLRIRKVNSAFVETFGVSEETAQGSLLGDCFGVPENASRIPPSRVDDEVVIEEVRRETPDGVREFLFRGFSVSSEDATQYYGIYTDITERKERQRELERKTERLEEFASIVSHDLRSPLSVASGWLELASEDASDEQRRAIDKAETALKRMETLIDDLLLVAHEGWTVESPHPVDGQQLVADAWNVVNTHEATLQCEWSDTVEADPERLGQAFENLFRNIVDHAGPDASVEVGSLADGAGVYVADDGPGIPDSVADSLFDMGVSADGGTGLGLAIVDRIVDAHGWSITATESTDGGARFDIRFDDEK